MYSRDRKRKFGPCMSGELPKDAKEILTTVGYLIGAVCSLSCLCLVPIQQEAGAQNDRFIRVNCPKVYLLTTFSAYKRCLSSEQVQLCFSFA